MADSRTKRLWQVAVGLAVLAGLLTLFNAAQDYRSTGALDWGRVALAIGIPAVFYAMAHSAINRKNP